MDAAPKQNQGKEREEIVRPINEEKREEQETMKLNSKIIIGVYAILILLGVGTGYLLSGGSLGTGLSGGKPTTIQTETAVGSTDATTFKDSAEGTVEKGGSDGEGTHKLVREGGPSQTVYLVSSVVDLDEFAGKRVKIWGQTMAAKKVAWLMDVGKVERISE